MPDRNNGNDAIVSTREFDSFKEAIVDALSSGFDGVHKRLDVTNGRIGKHDTEIRHLLERAARQASDIAHMQSQIGEHQRRTDPPTIVHAHAREEDDPPATDNKPITIGDIKRVMWFAGLIGGGIGGLIKWGPVIWKVVSAANGVAP